MKQVLVIVLAMLYSTSYASVVTKFIQISAGPNHSLAIADDSTLWAWGNNEFGELGDGTIALWQLQ